MKTNAEKASKKGLKPVKTVFNPGGKRVRKIRVR